ncbi:MAG: sulfatase [Armatimonadota bacterium]
MKAIMVMYDSLNRRMLEPYGCDWVRTPNFARLAERAVTFDTCYVGSMPCMPARREIHTGRYNFLHCPWGPLEPFDDSMPEMLQEAGVYTHLVSDHYHYWEDGGATYHNRYNSWEFPRGQEGDIWKGVVGEIEIPPNINGKGRRQDWVNRPYMEPEARHPQTQTFDLGAEFLQRNHAEDNWFLTIETFDPHEPYFSPPRFKEFYPHEYDGPIFDWPGYRRVTESPEEVRHIRCENAALHSMCDYSLGRVLDLMDAYHLWDDTLLIVNTDHGFLLGEHGWWAKNIPPLYDEVAHTPLFIWDPRCRKAGERRQALVQTIDLAPTLLEYFGVERTPAMQGKPLRETVENDAPVREAALFGYHGSDTCCTDGRYVYSRPPVPENEPLNVYTLMPCHMRGMYRPEELRDATLAAPFSFTKETPLLRLTQHRPPLDHPKLLFDMAADPGQQHPLDDAEIESRMIAHMARLMQESDAPPEQFARMGLQAAVP